MTDEETGYAVLDPTDAPRTPSGMTDNEYNDLTGDLGLTEMRARLWYVFPGEDMTRHTQTEQEELYVLVEGAGSMRVWDGADEEVLSVPEGGAIRLAPETERQLFNDTDETAVWLVVGAPPVDGDGNPVDMED